MMFVIKKNVLDDIAAVLNKHKGAIEAISTSYPESGILEISIRIQPIEPISGLQDDPENNILLCDDGNKDILAPGPEKLPVLITCSTCGRQFNEIPHNSRCLYCGNSRFLYTDEFYAEKIAKEYDSRNGSTESTN